MDFWIGNPPESLGSQDLPLSFPQDFTFAAGGESDIDEYPESFLSGETTGRAVEIQVKMNDGEVLTVEPTVAPRSIRQHFPWLKGMRFFALFFPHAERPKLVTALGRKGQVLGRSKSHGGFLFWS
ncbi:MAG: hypothetical protein ACTHO8_12340 [Solirubrobacterales bacterium]